MKILQVKGTNLYDVFLGSGWEHHTRLKVIHPQGKMNILHVAGKFLNKIQIIEFIKERKVQCH